MLGMHPSTDRALVNKERLEMLSDGIFAIAMTLLVLDIKVPELDRHAASALLVAALREQLPHLLSFVISFVLAAQFWFFHHLVFHHLRKVSRIMIAWNLVFLMFVSLLPFSAGLMGRFIHSGTALGIYFGNQLLLSGLLLIMLVLAIRRQLLGDLSSFERRMIGFRLGSVALACSSAIVASIFRPQWAFLAALVVLVISRILRRRTALFSPASA